MWVVVATSLGLVAVFGLVTWWALEWNGVAVLRTVRPDGSPRDTHVWYADQGGGLWLEAATAERDFLVDIQRHPEVEVWLEDRVASYHAEILVAHSSHEEIRELMRAKYGCRDWWVGLLQNTSGSVAVQLNPSRTGSS